MLQLVYHQHIFGFSGRVYGTLLAQPSSPVHPVRRKHKSASGAHIVHFQERLREQTAHLIKNNNTGKCMAIYNIPWSRRPVLHQVLVVF